MELLWGVSVVRVKLVAGNGGQHCPLEHRVGMTAIKVSFKKEINLGQPCKTLPVISDLLRSSLIWQEDGADLQLPPGVKLPQLLHCFRQVDLVGVPVPLLTHTHTDRKQHNRSHLYTGINAL